MIEELIGKRVEELKAARERFLGSGNSKALNRTDEALKLNLALLRDIEKRAKQSGEVRK
jgi:hypothetical protein